MGVHASIFFRKLNAILPVWSGILTVLTHMGKRCEPASNGEVNTAKVSNNTRILAILALCIWAVWGRSMGID